MNDQYEVRNKNISSSRNNIISKPETGSSLSQTSSVGLGLRSLYKIPLEKQFPKYSASSPQYYVLPAGGMHFAIPNLEVKSDRSKNDRQSSKLFKIDEPEYLQKLPEVKSDNTPRLTKFNGSSYHSDPVLESHIPKDALPKDSRLPLGLVLTAGSGQQKIEIEGSSKNRGHLPSETLMASAAFLKSYFTSFQDKNSQSIEQDADESMKNKMLGLWHNMKYGWSSSIKTEFSKETPIYLLGRVYHKSFKEDKAYDGTGFVYSDLEGFKQDFRSLSWFTYRRKFSPLPESTLTTDCGWGCMIRSGQMMLATALMRHLLPPGWRYDPDDDSPGAWIHHQVVKWFCDSQSVKCPFSLHNLVTFGHKMKKKAGNWYGPSCVAHMIKEALKKGSKEFPALENITVYVAQDGAIYMQDVFESCTVQKCICSKMSRNFDSTDSVYDAQFNQRPSYASATIDASECSNHSNNRRTYSCDNSSYSASSSASSCEGVMLNLEDKYLLDLFVDSNREFYDRISSKTSSDKTERECCCCHCWRSCLILIPVRLGGTSMNPIYHEIIYNLLFHDLCVGIIGGRPKHSLYFVGFQEDSLIHLDPHFSQDAVPENDLEFSLKSFHCSSPKKLLISKMDPSATIGFYCHTRNQFQRFKDEVSRIATARDGTMDSPIFEFVEGKMTDVNGWLTQALSQESAELDLVATPQELQDESEVLVLD